MDRCLVCEKSDLADIVLNNLEMKKCPKCGLIRLENIEASEDYYQTVNIELDLAPEKIKVKTANALEKIKQFRKKVSLDNLCDIGCGEGTFLKALKEKGHKNIIGIEPNINYLNFSKNSGLEVFQARLDDFPKIAEEREIKTASMFHLIEHLENPLESLKIIYQALSKGGNLIIETPDINSYSFRKSNYQHKLIYPEHIFYFSRKSLRKILEKAGFRIKAIGKRDFNQNSLGIKELLFRLGLVKKRPFLQGGSSEGSENSSRRNNLTGRRIKSIIRFILLKIVMLLGRLDFLWVIAEK